MKFKTSQIAEEFRSEKVDPRIRSVLFELDWQMQRRFIYELTVTDVVRSISEEGSLNPKISQSPHVISDDNPFCRAIDFRNKDMSEGQRQFIKEFVAFHFPTSYRLLENDRGMASAHFHLDCYPKHRLSIQLV